MLGLFNRLTSLRHRLSLYVSPPPALRRVPPPALYSPPPALGTSPLYLALVRAFARRPKGPSKQKSKVKKASKSQFHCHQIGESSDSRLANRERAKKFYNEYPHICDCGDCFRTREELNNHINSGKCPLDGKRGNRKQRGQILVGKWNDKRAAIEEAFSTRGKVQCNEYQPELLWAQRSDKVYLTVSLPDAKDVSVKCEADGFFSFSAVGVNGKPFNFTLQFYGNITPQGCKTKIGLRSILCSIQKEQKGWWETLLKAEEKPALSIKVDWDKWKWYEDDEESDDNQASDDDIVYTGDELSSDDEEMLYNLASDDDIVSTGENEESSDDEEMLYESKSETPKKEVETSKKGPAEAANTTPVTNKKAEATPQKTDGKQGAVHVNTPHPAKKAGK